MASQGLCATYAGWTRDGESKVQKIVHNAVAEVTRFVRFTLGEGIEKETTDFAAEVAAAGV